MQLELTLPWARVAHALNSRVKMTNCCMSKPVKTLMFAVVVAGALAQTTRAVVPVRGDVQARRRDDAGVPLRPRGSAAGAHPRGESAQVADPQIRVIRVAAPAVRPGQLLLD